MRQRTLDDLLAEAAARIERLEPAAARAAVAVGAVLVDIRSESDRVREGIVPGAFHIPRTVLEWRICPGSPLRNPHVEAALDDQVILMCDHGFSSVLAAATLADLGFTRPCDVIGGFAGWRDAGLPTGEAGRARRQPGEPAGMTPPDR